MTLIENGMVVYDEHLTPGPSPKGEGSVATAQGMEVWLWVPQDVEDLLKEYFLLEMLQGQRQEYDEGIVHLRMRLSRCRVVELRTGMLQAMFDTDLINLN